jgi:hypothetical protein
VVKFKTGAQSMKEGRKTLKVARPTVVGVRKGSDPYDEVLRLVAGLLALVEP